MAIDAGRRVVLAALLLAPLAARGQTVLPADQAAIRLAITRQIEAFRRDDAQAAYAIAAPGIQRDFGTPDRFMDMVRRAFPSVYRPRAVEFGELRTEDGAVIQEVELVGPSGQADRALYTMERDAAGTWRIAACVLVHSARLGA